VISYSYLFVFIGIIEEMLGRVDGVEVQESLLSLLLPENITIGFSP